jgi:hypothetical protein
VLKSGVKYSWSILRVFDLYLESWAAIAPGLRSREDWLEWLQHPTTIDEPLGKVELNEVPAMLRRRFNTLGKCAMGVALPLTEGIDEIPSIFASRHGDTELTISLLKSLGRDEPLSPTSFSLAVHNAISGLFTIARRDTSAVTAISAMQGLVLQTIFEAIGQLLEQDRLLCVIYDMPLPDFYRQHHGIDEAPFPLAIAMLLNRNRGERYMLLRESEARSGEAQADYADAIGLLRLLAGCTDQLRLRQTGSGWRMARAGV